MVAESMWIGLTGISARGNHGVFDHERRDGQEFRADVRMLVTLDPSADDLTATVDYGEVARVVATHLGGDPVNLIETLAARIADAVMAFGPVEAAEVVVHKPQAPVGVPFTDVAVTVIRSKQ